MPKENADEGMKTTITGDERGKCLPDLDQLAAQMRHEAAQLESLEKYQDQNGGEQGTKLKAIFTEKARKYGFNVEDPNFFQGNMRPRKIVRDEPRFAEIYTAWKGWQKAVKNGKKLEKLNNDKVTKLSDVKYRYKKSRQFEEIDGKCMRAGEVPGATYNDCVTTSMDENKLKAENDNPICAVVKAEDGETHQYTEADTKTKMEDGDQCRFKYGEGTTWARVHEPADHRWRFDTLRSSLTPEEVLLADNTKPSELDVQSLQADLEHNRDAVRKAYTKDTSPNRGIWGTLNGGGNPGPAELLFQAQEVQNFPDGKLLSYYNEVLAQFTAVLRVGGKETGDPAKRALEDFCKRFTLGKAWDHLREALEDGEAIVTDGTTSYKGINYTSDRSLEESNPMAHRATLTLVDAAKNSENAIVKSVDLNDFENFVDSGGWSYTPTQKAFTFDVFTGKPDIAKVDDGRPAAETTVGDKAQANEHARAQEIVHSLEQGTAELWTKDGDPHTWGNIADALEAGTGVNILTMATLGIDFKNIQDIRISDEDITNYREFVEAQRQLVAADGTKDDFIKIFVDKTTPRAHKLTSVGKLFQVVMEVALESAATQKDIEQMAKIVFAANPGKEQLLNYLARLMEEVRKVPVPAPGNEQKVDGERTHLITKLTELKNTVTSAQYTEDTFVDAARELGTSLLEAMKIHNLAVLKELGTEANPFEPNHDPGQKNKTIKEFENVIATLKVQLGVHETDKADGLITGPDFEQFNDKFISLGIHMTAINVKSITDINFNHRVHLISKTVLEMDDISKRLTDTAVRAAKLPHNVVKSGIKSSVAAGMTALFKMAEAIYAMKNEGSGEEYYDTTAFESNTASYFGDTPNLAGLRV